MIDYFLYKGIWLMLHSLRFQQLVARLETTRHLPGKPLSAYFDQSHPLKSFQLQARCLFLEELLSKSFQQPFLIWQSVDPRR